MTEHCTGRRIVGGECSNRKTGRGNEQGSRQWVDDEAFTPCAIQEERSRAYNLVAGRVPDKKRQAGHACHECLKLVVCRQGTGRYETDGDIVHTFLLGFEELRAQIDSPLAEKAWDALQRGIFTHVCPLVFRKCDEPVGTGQLVEISLVDGGYPGCQHARVLKTWEA